jgi:hypothetical protein
VLLAERGNLRTVNEGSVRIPQAVGEVALPEVLVPLRNSKTRTPRVLTFTEGNTEASDKGEGVEVRRSPQAVARGKRYVRELGKSHSFLTEV